MGLPAMKIDTYKSVKDLIKSGVKASPAEAIVELVRSNTPDLSHLVTEKQLNKQLTAAEERLRAEIRTEVSLVRAEIHSTYITP